MDKDKVLDLAKLARIKIDPEEADNLSREFEAILKYVGEVKSVSKADSLEPSATSFPIKNVFRADGEGHEPGLYTERILNGAPDREGNYIRVKKIL